jgi:hypothetical protein
MLIEALVGINVAVADESGLKDAFTGLTAEEKRTIYLETLTREELERIEGNTARLTRGASAGDPYWCLGDDELFAVVVDTCGPEPK